MSELIWRGATGCGSFTEPNVSTSLLRDGWIPFCFMPIWVFCRGCLSVHFPYYSVSRGDSAIQTMVFFLILAIGNGHMRFESKVESINIRWQIDRVTIIRSCFQ